MSGESATRRLLAAAERYAAGFRFGDLPPPPRLAVAILTCMDARIVPHRLFGLEEGDAHVLRNAGGRASADALRSLIASTRLLGVREILVVQHTDCGMMGLDEEALRSQLRRETGADPSAIEFLSFDDLEANVRRDVATVRSSPFLAAGVAVRGFVYEVAVGRLREID